MSDSPSSYLSSISESLRQAVDEGDADRVNSLLGSPEVAVDASNKHGETALHMAAGSGREDMIRALCASGASVNVTDKRGDTPLYWAARQGHLEAVKHLCTLRANLNVRDVAKETALHVCARYDQPEVLYHLCAEGAELNLPDNEGDTPLHCGVWHGYQGVVECLVRAGSSLHCTNRDGEMPLHVAAVRGYLSLVRFLCENRAGVNARDKVGCTAVHLATRRSHTQIIDYLCSSAHCDVNIQNRNGDTALHDVCRNGNLADFHILLRAGSRVDLRNKNGATPLHLAAKYGHLDLVRGLCTSGADVNAVTDQGHTVLQVAVANSHQQIAVLVDQLGQGDCLEHCIAELTSSSNSTCSSVPQKLLVGGASGVGKTELVNSLKCSYLRSMFRRRRSSSLSHMTRQKTYGMTVQRVTVPGAGEFSVWDFSGMKSFYPLHEEFLRDEAAILLLVFSRRDPLEKQLAHLRFWLAMIKAKLPQDDQIWFAGQRKVKPRVILVASFADLRSPDLASTDKDEGEEDLVSVSPQPTVDKARLSISSQDELILSELQQEFGDGFDFSGVVFSLDCRLSQSSEMKELRSHLAAVRDWMAQPSDLPSASIVQTLSCMMGAWRADHASFPVLTWQEFVEKTRTAVNPLVSEDFLKSVTKALHGHGEVVYIEDDLLANIVVLDPAWLGRDIFGAAFSQLKSVTGHISLSLLRHAYPSWDPGSVAHLFEHFDLCVSVDEQRSTFLFPGLIQMEPLYGLWEKDPEFTVYSGLHVTCQRDSDLLSPSLFPKIQIHARKMLPDDIEDQELTLWSGGLKCCRGGVEVLLSYPKLHRTVEILVRGTEETRLDCYYLLQQFYSIVTGVVKKVNPGTAVETRLLSPRRLKSHRQPVLSYPPEHVFQAERGDGILDSCNGSNHVVPGEKEHLVDVACCGCEEMLPATKSAPFSHLSSLSVHSRNKLSRLLDPPHPLGQDWCLLALQLSFMEDVPRIYQASPSLSPTDQLLKAWEKNSQSTVLSVIDALRAIGRSDAASAIILGLSPFANTSNTVVIDLPGAVVTSYLC